MATFFMKLGFDDRVLSQDGFYYILLNGEKIGYNIDIRLNNYRGLYVANVEELELKIDGEVVDHDKIIAGINGKEFRLDQLPDLYEEYWGIKTVMSLNIFDPDLAPGEHHVELKLLFKSPYMKFEHDNYGVIDSSAEKTMILEEERELQ